MTFSVITFGCKVNQGESENIISAMMERGYTFLDSNSKADISIINSCTVTAESDRKLRQFIHKVRRESPNAIIVLTGCMPQAFPEVAAKLSDVQIVVGNQNKQLIPQLIEEYIENQKNIFSVNDISNLKVFEDRPQNFFSGRFRAFLKIQDGCDRFCSYCIIPYARGRIRSKTLESIERDAISLSQNGYKEIVLTGINLSSYGKDLGITLENAIEKISDIPGIERIRLGSLEPDLVTPEFVEFVSRENKFCPQFHLSLQSGSDEILRKMRRRYTKAQYLELVKLIRSKIPNVTFTTDFMVGFPGETDKHFEESLELISEVKFLKVHVFPYSPRPGTMAAGFDNQIEKSVKINRVRKAIDISHKNSKLILDGFVNCEMKVLYENFDSGFYKGHTMNYIPVKVESDMDIRGQILSTTLTHNTGECFEGILTN